MTPYFVFRVLLAACWSVTSTNAFAEFAETGSRGWACFGSVAAVFCVGFLLLAAKDAKAGLS